MWMNVTITDRERNSSLKKKQKNIPNPVHLPLYLHDFYPSFFMCNGKINDF